MEFCKHCVLTEYRKRVTTEWEKLPALKPGDQKDWDGNRYRISAMMETLAEQSGDLEAWVVVKARNLSVPYAYLQIAEAYRKHGQREQAMHWAEQGLAAFAEKSDYALIEFLIEEYRYHTLPDKALALAWKRYEGRPEPQYYKALHTNCAKGEWSALREQALSWLRDSIKYEFGLGKQLAWRRTAEPEQTRLVEILLWEKKIDEAWAEANAGVCEESIWLKLAEKRAAQHPEDAIKVYKWLINKRVPLTNNRAYADAAELVKKIKPIITQSRGKNAFDDYLAELRVTYKEKRNFIKLLEKF
jgi:uncharacterized Zn finger protein